MTETNLNAAINLLAHILECPADTLSAEDTIENVEKWDSLNHMRMILRIEEQYQIQVETDDAMQLFTVKDIADYLARIAKSPA